METGRRSLGSDPGHVCGASIHNVCRVYSTFFPCMLLYPLRCIGFSSHLIAREYRQCRNRPSYILFFPRLFASGLVSLVPSFELTHANPSTAHSRVAPGSSTRATSVFHYRIPALQRHRCYGGCVMSSCDTTSPQHIALNLHLLFPTLGK